MQYRLFIVLIGSLIFSHYSYSETANKFVGIQYSVWFDHVRYNNCDQPLNIPPTIYPNYIGVPGFRYWGVPARGTYLSSNSQVIHEHADELSAAGIDFIYIDLTNVLDCHHLNATETLLSIYQNRILMGRATPQVVFFAMKENSNHIYQKFYSTGLYNESVFFKYGNKPLFISAGGCSTDLLITSNLMCRPIEGLENTGFKWSFLARTPQKPFNKSGWAEQMAVSPAQQQSYMDAPGARGRKFSMMSGVNSGSEGSNYRDQWASVFDVGATFVLIKSYNEWVAQRLCEEGCFTDEFNREFSTDIEPMGQASCAPADKSCVSHGDLYLSLTQGYIKEYKSIAADIVLRDSSSGLWIFKYGRNGEQFAENNYSTSFPWVAGDHYQPIVGDFNNDGKLDIALRDITNGMWHFAFSNGSGAYHHTRNFNWVAGSHYQPFVGDFNGDGKTDIGLRDTSTGVWHFAYFDGISHYAHSKNFQWATGAHYQAFVGDFNDDGYIDIGLRDTSNGTIHFSFNNSKEYYHHTRNFNWHKGSQYQIYSGDFNCDKKHDLILRNSTDGRLHLLTFDGAYTYQNRHNYAGAVGGNYQLVYASGSCSL